MTPLPEEIAADDFDSIVADTWGDEAFENAAETEERFGGGD